MFMYFHGADPSLTCLMSHDLPVHTFLQYTYMYILTVHAQECLVLSTDILKLHLHVVMHIAFLFQILEFHNKHYVQSSCKEREVLHVRVGCNFMLHYYTVYIVKPRK